MALPGLADYSAAIQHPHIAFGKTDAELAKSKAELTIVGPKARTGGFAVTFKLMGASEWAVRCFHKEIGDLEQRYEQITRFLKGAKREFLTDFAYLHTGILVNGQIYPVVKMPWVNDPTLGAYLERYYKDPSRLKSLFTSFTAVVGELEALGMAHGDLQHGNILVGAEGVRLIDYDGMFVPGMPLTSASEIGHVNYQSPHRNAKSVGPHWTGSQQS